MVAGDTAGSIVVSTQACIWKVYYGGTLANHLAGMGSGFGVGYRDLSANTGLMI
jgi:hypothetical protein